MPTRFTAEQLTVSAAAGEPRSEDSFAGDRAAWHAYQDAFFSTVTLGETLPPVGDSDRAKRWKAARRQRGKIEEQRAKDAAATVVLAAQDGNADAGRLSKRLKVSEAWQGEHVAGVQQLVASTPQASPSGQHATRQLRATVATPGGETTREYVGEVCYSLPPPEGERESAAKRREDRHRRREQLALERLGGAYEKELAAEAAAEAADAQKRAEEEARLQRMAAVVRDGNTIYVHETFICVDPAAHRTAFGSSSSWTSFDQRDLRVYYPDGSSCNVDTPCAHGTRTPWRLVQPWTWRAGVLPPIVCTWATLDELSKLSVALISMSDKVGSGQAAGWRRRYLTMAVCCNLRCPYSGDCVTYALPEAPASSALARLGIAWAARATIGGSTDPLMAAPVHMPLSIKGCWPDGRPPREVADACAAAVLPDGQPRPRTVFTAVATRRGLPPSLRYMQEGDVVLWKGAPHYVYRIGAPVFNQESEILFRTPAQHGRDRGLANPPEPVFMSRVVYELEPPTRRGRRVGARSGRRCKGRDACRGAAAAAAAAARVALAVCTQW